MWLTILPSVFIFSLCDHDHGCGFKASVNLILHAKTEHGGSKIHCVFDIVIMGVYMSMKCHFILREYKTLNFKTGLKVYAMCVHFDHISPFLMRRHGWILCRMFSLPITNSETPIGGVRYCNNISLFLYNILRLLWKHKRRNNNLLLVPDTCLS